MRHCACWAVGLWLMWLPAVAHAEAECIEEFEQYGVTKSWAPDAERDGWFEATAAATGGFGIVESGGSKVLRADDAGGESMSIQWSRVMSKEAAAVQRLSIDVRLEETGTVDSPFAMVEYRTEHPWSPLGRVSLSCDYGLPAVELSVKETPKQYKTVPLPGGSALRVSAWYTVQLEVDLAARRVRARYGPRGGGFYAWTEWEKTDHRAPSSVRLTSRGVVAYDNLGLASPVEDEAVAALAEPGPTIVGHPLLASEGLSIYRVSPHYKVYPEDPFEVAPEAMPRLELCRGEYEPFQIALRSAEALEDVTVEAEGLPEGVTFQCQPAELVDIKQSKVRTGLTPDPLLNDPRIDVPAERNRSFWLTLRSERGAAAGDFELACRVLAGSKELGAFRLPVRVWDFPMPKLPHLASLVEFRLCNAASSFYKGFYEWPIERQIRLIRAHYRWYQKHRLQPGVVWPEVRVEQDASGEWVFANRDVVAEYFPQFWKEFPGVFQFMWLRTGLVGYGTNFPQIDTEEGQKELEYQRNLWRLFLELADEKGWPVRERYVWYAGDEPICPHYETREEPIRSLRDYVRAVRPVVGNMAVMASAWPFDRTLLSSVDIWTMRAYCSPDFPLDRMPVAEARCYGKALGLTLDGSLNLCMDREAINHRLDAWHTWYDDLPMMEYFSNLWWQFCDPWNPPEQWYSEGFCVPGDGNIIYPPKDGMPEDQILTSIRAENLREGMEDYEYLWLLRHASKVIRSRSDARAATESDLLERIDRVLWDARQWVYRGASRGKDDKYILMTYNLRPERMPWLASKLDRLRSEMAATLQEAYRKGYLEESTIDQGHKPPRYWTSAD